MHDDIARHNKARWEELAQANVDYSRPFLGLNADSSRQVLDPFQVMGEVNEKNVLCLASGGGQQSAAFALLGAAVSVLDFSETQLDRDRQALAHYGLQARLEQGDMRDLSRFADESFDLIWHAWSINFIPDTAPVFDEVRRVLRPGGLYRLQWNNPFSGTLDDTDWTGSGYVLNQPYADGETHYVDEDNVWVFEDLDGTVRQVAGPRVFKHTLSTVVNGLIQRGFTLRGLWEEICGDIDAPPGSWDHCRAIAPHGITLWAQLAA